MESFGVRTESRNCLVDITAQVRSAVAGSGAESGIAFIYVPHTTAAVTVNESYDPDVGKDIESTLSKLVPARAGYAHSEGNADAHIKATLVGSCAQVPVEDGNLMLGRWQGVFFCEFDGPRTRRVLVKVLKSAE
jgi:secondary thiamine-phosphate synthase enzyme